MNARKIIYRVFKKSWFIFAFAIFFNSGFALETEERIVASFDIIRATGRVKVFLKPGKSERLRIETRGVEISKVFTVIDGTTLKIYIQKGFIDDNIDVKVYVTYKVLREVHSSALADIQAESAIKGDKLVVDVNSKGRANVKVDVNTLELMVSVSGELEISGKTKIQNTRVNSDGKLKAFNLQCEKTYIKINTAGIAEVRAGELLDATVHTGGNLRYKGNPSKETIKSTLGGTVTRLAD
ncbi:hypothetical protein LCGC14_2926810 [marine sediment metagenome]|uniref:Putative auto-transporter adhesin head GIN domain-containing protein n=1 Tax=marine sediment metagenome TaxID=412755 RepID=A0A0F8XMF0_9ZZZZ|nr:DUF2807 domain-containing protein [Spirochaetota bacterium]